MEKSSLAKYLKKARLRVSLPFLSYEVTLDDLIDSKDVDERIERLSTIKNDLEETIVAVEQLQAEAFKSKNEANKLKETISLLEQDKSTAEAMVKLPEESFSRVLSRASSKGRVRGIIEGIIIGFITGILSSLLVWYLTK
jgi:predicted nuclease with TOPRIM domain